MFTSVSLLMGKPEKKQLKTNYSVYFHKKTGKITFNFDPKFKSGFVKFTIDELDRTKLFISNGKLSETSSRKLCFEKKHGHISTHFTDLFKVIDMPIDKGSFNCVKTKVESDDINKPKIIGYLIDLSKPIIKEKKVKDVSPPIVESEPEVTESEPAEEEASESEPEETSSEIESKSVEEVLMETVQG